MRSLLASLMIVAVVAPMPANAWSRPGHMVAAAIAYDELMRDDPAVVAEMLRLLAAHPDPGPFQVAIDRTEGAERDGRLFLEMARWPDDVRGGPDDHPTWHYRLYVVGKDDGIITKGSGVEALALNLSVARDPRAPAADRAVALCWILHVVADLHQPLHSAERVAPDWPQGDEGGSKVFVRYSVSGKPVSLHWFWDDSVSRDGSAAAAFARARDLEVRFPRARFAEALLHPVAAPDASERWLAESYALAVSVAYRADAPHATSAATARPAAPGYTEAVAQVSEQRVALAGYRLADLLRTVFAARPAN
ncbi:S1/P1 nuclease [Sphingomonas sp.]|uniref:S1/P1 nuclease n=1 Tax=Sphingomonas sp. TaxID=28214 RepID=UPI003D6D9CA7